MAKRFLKKARINLGVLEVTYGDRLGQLTKALLSYPNSKKFWRDNQEIIPPLLWQVLRIDVDRPLRYYNKGFLRFGEPEYWGFDNKKGLYCVFEGDSSKVYADFIEIVRYNENIEKWARMDEESEPPRKKVGYFIQNVRAKGTTGAASEV